MGRGVAFRGDAAMAAGSDAPPRQSLSALASPGQKGGALSTAAAVPLP